MIVVTGGSKGIGKAIVEKFAANGFDVATCSRKAEPLEKLKKEIESKYSTKVFIQTADLSVKEDTQNFIDFVKRIEQPVEVLVNNTGVFIPGSIHNEPEGAFETQMHTNLFSTYYVTRGLIGEMIERKSGHVFNIASIASFMAYSSGGSYAISKHAMLGFSKCLREEMKEFNIRVTAIMPGATLTDSFDNFFI